jgi:PPOX class probable F420-dependent enzyme
MESMTKDEWEAFLDAPARSAAIATMRADGRPHVATIWFARDGERIIFTSWHTSVKVQNILRDGRVALCIDHDAAPWHYVLIEGRAAVLDKSVEAIQHWTRAIAARYVGEERAKAVTESYAIEGEWVFELIPEKVIAHKDVVNV